MTPSAVFSQKSYADLFESRLYFPLHSTKQLKDYKRLLKKIKDGGEAFTYSKSLEPRRIELLLSLQQEADSYVLEEQKGEYFALFQKKVLERLESLRDIDENAFFREEKAHKRQIEDAEILKRRCRKRKESLEDERSLSDLESLEHQEMQRRFGLEESALAEIFGIEETLLLPQKLVEILQETQTLFTLRRFSELGFKLDELQSSSFSSIRQFFRSLGEKIPGWSIKTKKLHYISLLEKGMHTKFYLSLSCELQKELLDNPNKYSPLFESNIDLSLTPFLTPPFQILFFEKLLSCRDSLPHLDLNIFWLEQLVFIGKNQGWIRQADIEELFEEVKRRGSFSKLYEAVRHQDKFKRCYLQLKKAFRSKEDVKAFFSSKESMRLFFLNHLQSLGNLQRESISLHDLFSIGTESLIRIFIKYQERLIALKKRSCSLFPRPDGISEDLYRLLVLKQPTLDSFEELGVSLDDLLTLPQDAQELFLRHADSACTLIREIPLRRLVSLPLVFLEQLLKNPEGACALLHSGISLKELSKGKASWRNLVLEKAKSLALMGDKASYWLEMISKENSLLKRRLLKAVESLPFLQEQGVFDIEDLETRDELLSHSKGVEALLKAGLSIDQIVFCPFRAILLKQAKPLGKWLECHVAFEEIKNLLEEEFSCLDNSKEPKELSLISNSLQVSYLLESGISLFELKSLDEEGLGLSLRFGESLLALHINGYAIEDLLSEEALDDNTRFLLLEKAFNLLYLLENSEIEKDTFDLLSFSEKEQLLRSPEAVCAWLNEGHSLDELFALPDDQLEVYLEHYHTLRPLLQDKDFEEIQIESNSLRELLYRHGEFFEALEKEGIDFEEDDLPYLEELLSQKESVKLIRSGWTLQELLLFPPPRIASLIEEL